MKKNQKKFLADITYALELIDDFLCKTTGFEDYQKDLKTKSAVERQLSIIGEAVNQLTKNNVSLTNARHIIDFRNRIIHSYDNLDDAIIWTILKKNLPVLKEEVNSLLES